MKSFTICLAVSTEYWRVTDGQTDRQTDKPRQQHNLPGGGNSNLIIVNLAQSAFF